MKSKKWVAEPFDLTDDPVPVREEPTDSVGASPDTSWVSGAELSEVVPICDGEQWLFDVALARTPAAHKTTECAIAAEMAEEDAQVLH